MQRDTNTPVRRHSSHSIADTRHHAGSCRVQLLLRFPTSSYPTQTPRPPAGRGQVFVTQYLASRRLLVSTRSVTYCHCRPVKGCVWRRCPRVGQGHLLLMTSAARSRAGPRVPGNRRAQSTAWRWRRLRPATDGCLATGWGRRRVRGRKTTPANPGVRRPESPAGRRPQGPSARPNPRTLPVAGRMPAAPAGPGRPRATDPRRPVCPPRPPRRVPWAKPFERSSLAESPLASPLPRAPSPSPFHETRLTIHWQMKVPS